MNSMKRLKVMWSDYRKQRRIKEYYLSQSPKPMAARFFIMLLLFILVAGVILWRVETYKQAMVLMGLSFVLVLAAFWVIDRYQLELVKEKCHEILGDKEFKKRLDNSSTSDVVTLISEEVGSNYPISVLEIEKDCVIGTYQGEKIAICYHYVSEDDSLETREVMQILRNCRQNGISQVTIFTNGFYSNKSPILGERYEIKRLKLYNGDMLKLFLKNTILYPSLREIENIVKKNAERRLQRIKVLKKEALQGKKSSLYFLYSMFLLVLAWYGIGQLYWNLFFSGLLFILGILSLADRFKKNEEEIFF